MQQYIICGSPRAGTTWLHNCLIKSGSFNGIEAIDSIPPSIYKKYFLTDEDVTLLKYLKLYKYGLFFNRLIYKHLFVNRLSKIFSLYAVNNKTMAESPYYVYFLNEFKDIVGKEIKIVFLKRNPMDVAVSMSKHIHMKSLLLQEYKKSFDLYSTWPKNNIEDVNAHPIVKEYVMDNYSDLNIVERALYKWHYFTRTFFIFYKTNNNLDILIIDYDKLSNISTLQSIESFFCSEVAATIKNDFINKKNVDYSSMLSKKGRILLNLIYKYTEEE